MFARTSWKLNQIIYIYICIYVYMFIEEINSGIGEGNKQTGNPVKATTNFVSVNFYLLPSILEL